MYGWKDAIASMSPLSSATTSSGGLRLKTETELRSTPSSVASPVHTSIGELPWVCPTLMPFNAFGSVVLASLRPSTSAWVPETSILLTSSLNGVTAPRANVGAVSIPAAPPTPQRNRRRVTACVAMDGLLLSGQASYNRTAAAFFFPDLPLECPVCDESRA